jgi:hypothetical protein
MSTVTVSFDMKGAPPGWKPDPLPGSEDARMQGCNCPEKQPPYPSYTFDIDCPVHELEEVLKQ